MCVCVCVLIYMYVYVYIVCSGQTIEAIMHEVEDLIVLQEVDGEHQHK